MSDAPSYRLVNVSGGRYALTLVDPPARCLALSQAPEEAPAELQRGSWIVLAFAVWRTEDHESIELALDVVAERGGQRGLALLPFAELTELEAVASGVDLPATADGGPVWLMIDDGRFTRRLDGVLTWGDLSELLG